VSEEEAIEAYAGYALSGDPLAPEAQKAKAAFQDFIRNEYLLLSETLRKSLSWESFYTSRRTELHEKAVKTGMKFPTMPKKA
jgi:hypothetical protein